MFGRIILLQMINDEEEISEEIDTDCFELDEFDEDLEGYIPDLNPLFDD